MIRPALLSPFTLTLTLSHRGRGDVHHIPAAPASPAFASLRVPVVGLIGLREGDGVLFDDAGAATYF